jgi:hypothetical protein
MESSKTKQKEIAKSEVLENNFLFPNDTFTFGNFFNRNASSEMTEAVKSTKNI